MQKLLSSITRSLQKDGHMKFDRELLVLQITSDIQSILAKLY